MKFFAGKPAVCTIVSLMASLVLTPCGRAQTATTGALSGIVHDSGGGVVRGVSVTAINESTGERRLETTSPDGTYRLTLLSLGSYQVEAAKAGFKAAIHRGVRVTVTETQILDIRLEIGDVHKSIEVTIHGRSGA
jgi:hypothetical protein